MAVKLKTSTTLATGGLAVTGVGVAASFAEIADFVSRIQFETIPTLSQFAIMTGSVPGITAAASVGAAAGVGYLLARKKARGHEARLAVLDKRIESCVQTNLSHLSFRLENASMLEDSLCRNLTHLLRGMCDKVERFFEEKEGRPCMCSVHLLCQDGTLHVVEYRSRDALEKRHNLPAKPVAPGTNIERLKRLKDTDVQLVRSEFIGKSDTVWCDPSAEDHQALYDASLTVGIEYKPDTAYDYGHFTHDLPNRRVLAGYLTIDLEGKRFRSPAVEDAALRIAGRLFSVVREYSKAHYDLVGASDSPISWVYRDVAGARKSPKKPKR